jgi:hypothetical protein
VTRMTDLKISPQIVDTSIREAIDELLHKHGVYQLGSYGYSGPNDYDDEMIGHAMWQENSLYSEFTDRLYSAAYANGTPPKELESWQQYLVKSGGDFASLVEAARLSVGLTLFYQSATERDHYEESSFFQLHLISSIVLLNTASDRLRDLFVAAVFNVTAEQYVSARTSKGKIGSKLDRKASRYDAPFYEAADRTIGDIPKFAESLPALLGLADRMYGFRETRNDTVHDVATELGRQQWDHVKKTISAQADEDISYEEIRKHHKEAAANHRTRVSADVEQLICWYKVLIEMSNHVFIVEYWFRHQKLRLRCDQK